MVVEAALCGCNLKLNDNEIAYIGDDLPDLPVLQKVGFSACPNNAVENIKNFIAEYIVGKEISESVEKISEFIDGTEGIYTEDNFSELINSKRKKIKHQTQLTKRPTKKLQLQHS